MSEAKSERINVRLSPDALEMLRAAATVQQQDLTSFVLGAAMERARAVLAEDRILRLTPHEVNQLEKALDSEPEVVPQLRAFLQRFSEARKPVSQLALAAWSCPAQRGPGKTTTPPRLPSGRLCRVLRAASGLLSLACLRHRFLRTSFARSFLAVTRRLNDHRVAQRRPGHPRGGLNKGTAYCP